MMHRCLSVGMIVVAFTMLSPRIHAGEVVEHRDLVFATVDGHDLKLNVFVPAGVERPPLVVYIHGGSWRAGSYKSCPVAFLTEEGFAVASIGYRLSNVAIFPAQIHDCKGAVRWLRAHADKFGFDPDRIAVAGGSAGGHLAVLLGVSSGVEALEGTTAGHLDQSSAVKAIVDYYGPTDFILRAKTHPQRTTDPESGVYALLGGAVPDKLELARLASCVTHVDAGDPPLLIIHGDKDEKVYLDQSHRLHEVYQEAGISSQLHIVPGGRHGGSVFYSGPAREQAVAFLRKHLAP